MVWVDDEVMVKKRVRGSAGGGALGGESGWMSGVGWRRGAGRVLLVLVVMGVGALSGAAQSLAGNWKDSNGDLITITQVGNEVTAVPDSAKVLRYWTVGKATLQGGKLRMVHSLNGRTTATEEGTVSNGNRIDWSNGSHWSKQAATAEASVGSLAGTWKDSNGDEIAIAGSGSSYTATPVSAALKRWWSVGNATVTGQTIVIVHKLGDRETAHVSGKVTSADRIDWNNGTHWTRVGAAAKVVATAETLEEDRAVTLFPETYTVPTTFAAGALKFPVKLTFFNEAGYVARFTLTYFAGGRVHSFKTGSMAFKERQQHVAVPASAESIYVTAEYWNFGWKRIFRERVLLEDRPFVTVNGKRVPDPAERFTEIGFKTYGTTFSPEWNNNVEPWVPTFSGAVHVANESGKPIYVGYCTDLGWSAANGALGVMRALIDDVRNGRRNAVKYLAIAMAADVKLPTELVEIFREVGVKVPHKDAQMVVETSIEASIVALFETISSAFETLITTVAGNIENNPEYNTKNLEMNPIIAGANVFGARTLNLVIFNADMSRYWIIPTTSDESWIIENDRAYLAKKGTLRVRDPLGRSYPGVPSGYSIPSGEAPIVSTTNGRRFSEPKLWISNFCSDVGWNKKDHTRLLADVNGDGKADIVGFGAAGVVVALSEGNRFGTPKLFLGKFGKQQGWDANRQRFLGDVDGDGRADVVAIDGNTAHVALSRGTDFAPPVAYPLDLNNLTPGENGSNDLRLLHCGWRNKNAYIWDFKKNVINTWSPFEGRFYLSQMKSDRLIETRGWTTANSTRCLGDVNGDGTMDVIGFRPESGKGIGITLALGTHPQSNVATESAQLRNFGSSILEGAFTVADVNGDGKDDAVGFFGGGTQVALAKYGGRATEPVPAQGAFEAPVLGLRNFSSDQGWTGKDHIRLMGDVDGDGRADIVGFTHNGVLVSTSLW